jgi:hypothetical protein
VPRPRLGTRGWREGILWALGLELAMVAVYPGWLHIGALLEEFVAVSLIGHLAYGSVLGSLSRYWLRSPQPVTSSPKLLPPRSRVPDCPRHAQASSGPALAGRSWLRTACLTVGDEEAYPG